MVFAPEQLPLPALALPDTAGLSLAGRARAVQAVAMKHAVQAVFVWLGQCVTATESRLHHTSGEGRAVPSLHLLHG